MPNTLQTFPWRSLAVAVMGLFTALLAYEASAIKTGLSDLLTAQHASGATIARLSVQVETMARAEARRDTQIVALSEQVHKLALRAERLEAASQRTRVPKGYEEHQ